MSKKKKKNKPYRSVLDESPIKDKSGNGADFDDPKPSAGNGSAISVNDPAFPPEDESISDVPPASLRRAAINAENASKVSAFEKDAHRSFSDGAAESKKAGEEHGESDFDDDLQEYDDPDNDGYVPSRLDRIIQYASALLSVLLLGGSIAFWFTILRYLINTPFALADPAEMRALIVLCACFPVIITVAQRCLKRPVSPERWLICLCTSGALAALFTVIYQALIRRVGFTPSELPLILCCAFSGCTLPSVICTGIRALIEKLRLHIAAENSRDWETVRGDILSLTDLRI